jgi:hypothetical protein
MRYFGRYFETPDVNREREPDSGPSWQTASESLYRARVYLSQYPETQWGIENGIGPAIMILFHCECALRLEHSQE